MPRDGVTAKLRSEVLSQRPQTTQPNALVASATNLTGAPDLEKRSKKLRKKSEWQDSVYGWYDVVSEYHYAVTWVGNLLSKATLKVVDAEGNDATDPRVLQAMADFYDGPEGQAEMLRMMGLHFTMAGEGYMILGAVDDGTTSGEEWFTPSATAIRQKDGAFTMSGVGFTGKPLVIRLWRAHPSDFRVADSPSRAAIPILAQIDALTKYVNAQVDSRLAGAGLLLIPSEIDFAGGGVQTGGGGAAPSADSIIRLLSETMAKSIRDRTDASSLVPIVFQAAGEWLDKIKHITFWSELDEHAIQLRQEAIGRLALGMDMPPEVLTGAGDLNHWGSWQVEEAGIKSHTEPLLKVITSSITKGYLHPNLTSLEEGKAMDEDEAAGYTVVADTSKMRLRPNRSKEALELFALGELSAEALLRENGFDPDDAIDDEGLSVWLLKKMASGSATPEMVLAAAIKLGVELDLPEQAPEENRPAPLAPSIEDHPAPEVPSPDDMNDPISEQAATIMVFRALERVGNRMKTKLRGNIPAGVEAKDLYLHVPIAQSTFDALLEDAWTCTQWLELGPQMEHLEMGLDRYVRFLMHTQQAHDPKIMLDYILSYATELTTDRLAKV